MTGRAENQKSIAECLDEAIADLDELAKNGDKLSPEESRRMLSRSFRPYTRAELLAEYPGYRNENEDE